MSVFVEGGKPEINPRSKDENQQQTQPTYGTGPESNPGHTTAVGPSSVVVSLSFTCI